MNKATKIALGIAGVVAIAGIGYAVYKAVAAPTEDPAFRQLGDVNGDGIIDAIDLQLIENAFGSTPGSPNWNPNADLNGDGVVDTRDLAICARNQGLDYGTWLTTQTKTLQSGPPPIGSQAAQGWVQRRQNYQVPDWRITNPAQARIKLQRARPVDVVKGPFYWKGRKGVYQQGKPYFAGMDYTVVTTVLPIKEI